MTEDTMFKERLIYVVSWKEKGRYYSEFYPERIAAMRKKAELKRKRIQFQFCVQPAFL